MPLLSDELHDDLLALCDDAAPPAALAALTECMCRIMAAHGMGPDQAPDAFRDFMELTARSLVARTRTISRELAETMH